MRFPRARPAMTQVATQLEQLAWGIAKPYYRARGAWPGDAPPDQWAAQEEKRWAALAMLKAYREVLEVAEANVEAAVFDALSNGSNYVEVAEAEGVSRQAVRQRVVRAGQPVRLVGGPRDGSTGTVPVGIGDTLCWEEARYTERRSFQQVEREILSCYTKKNGARGLFEFAGFIDGQGQPVPEERIATVQQAAARRAAKLAAEPAAGPVSRRRVPPMRLPRQVPLIRVHELAKELGQTSKRVLTVLEDLGAFVKSSSSTLAPTEANRVREHFKRLRPPGQT